MTNQPGSQTEPHHANETMRCAVDGEPWPCEAFRLARAAKPFGPLVIPPLRSKKVLRLHERRAAR